MLMKNQPRRTAVYVVLMLLLVVAAGAGVFTVLMLAISENVIYLWALPVIVVGHYVLTRLLAVWYWEPLRTTAEALLKEAQQQHARIRTTH